MARNNRIQKKIACTGKRCHKTRLHAANALMQGRLMGYYSLEYEIYHCWFCKCYHIGRWRGWKNKSKPKDRVKAK